MKRLVLDHLRYQLERRYRREIHAALRKRAHHQGIRETSILHEANGSCCRREPWALTALRLQQALADDGLGTALVDPVLDVAVFMFPPRGEAP